MSKPFSQQLQKWLTSNQPKTLDGASQLFVEKSFAVIVLVLMFLPALPLPTGGITHIFELIVMLLSVELIIGRRTVWLPKKWRYRPLGKFLETKTIPLIMRRIRWFERYSRPRFVQLLRNHLTRRLAGGLLFIFALAAFVAPPFAGLDTLPSLGCVIIALALLLEDVVVLIGGVLIGLVGVGLVIATGGITLHLINHFIH